MKKLTAVVLGYGSRGACYSKYALDNPEELEIVAVAEALQARWDTAKKRFSLSDDRIYTTWEDLAAQPKMADFAIIATQDNMHCAPALAMIEKGYHLLLEKPMAPTPPRNAKPSQKLRRKRVSRLLCAMCFASQGSGKRSKTFWTTENWATRSPSPTLKTWATYIKATASSEATGATRRNPPV